MASKTPTSLVLGSGGAKGLAHIGVIRCLEDRGHDIRYVAGSSIGALIGGVYAEGKLEVYAEWVSALQRSDIMRLLDWSFDGGAIFKGDRIISVLRDLIDERDIEDLPVGFTAVATDLMAAASGREVWLNHGPLFDAIRASMAVPTIFAPVRLGDRLLVDGGVVNPVPVAPTLNDHTSMTIAVDLNGPHVRGTALPAHEPRPESKLQQAYHQAIGQYLDKLWPSSPLEDDDSDRVGFADVATRSMEAMQATITRFKLAATVPTVVITIPRNLCGFFDFYRANELIEYGYERAAQTLDQFEADNGRDGSPEEVGGGDDADDTGDDAH